MTRRAEAVLWIVLGIAFILVAIMYWAEPAKSLPSFVPGHDASSTTHHIKHGLAALILGLGCFVLAWFRSAPPKDSAAATAADTTEQAPGNDAE